MTESRLSWEMMKHTLKHHGEVWNDSTLREMVLDILLTIGTNFILRCGPGQKGYNILMAEACSICALLRVVYDGNDDWLYRATAAARDLSGGGERELIRFFSK